MSLLIFDLDGTLIDSRLDLAHAVNATRTRMGMGHLAHEIVYSYVGNGAPVLIERAMGPDATDEVVASALAFFLDYYKHHAVDYTELYPGVRRSLEDLHKAGHLLTVLTNKPVRISERIVEHFGLTPLIVRTYGGNSFEHKKPHPIGIDTLREELNATREDTWMIGDSYVDVQTARNAGVPVCGVTYGFQPDSLVEFPPDVLVDKIEDFASRMLSRP
jgi:phosphoglycolate phosphatase